jgi:hypothetical protein
LVSLLRGIQRPPDIKIEHLEALGLNVISGATPEDIIPDSSYLPPREWTSIPVEELEDANPATMRPLNNDRNSPGVKTYIERLRELSIQNSPAFRTIRRLPAPPGETAARLGNAYEFFKNLELLSGYWVDTSLPPSDNVVASTEPQDAEAMDVDTIPLSAASPMVNPPPHQQIHHRTGTGSQMPSEFRTNLLTALTKLVAYDFGCNVSLPRVEPRLYITSSNPRMTSSFPSSLTYIYRTPTDRSAARSGIVEGPLAALSSRPSTLFNTDAESIIDLCRETVAILITAQHRARESQEEKRIGEGAWWCTRPRWGGGTGGPIGKEGERAEKAAEEAATAKAGAAEAGQDPGLGPAKKSRKTTMTMYDAYRIVRGPSSTWDRKARYLGIGKEAGSTYDDIFLLSALNHHVSVVRVRVPGSLLEELAGAQGNEREGVVMWRSKWWDMFLVDDRVEAMRCIWGMMAYMMRRIETAAPTETQPPPDTAP